MDNLNSLAMSNWRHFRHYLAARFLRRNYFRGLGILFLPIEQRKLMFCQAVLEEGDLAIDLGAHLGLFTQFFEKCVGPKGKVIAFEPNPYVFKILQKTAKQKRNVEVEQYAVSDQSNKLLDFYIEPFRIFYCGTSQIELVSKDRFQGKKKKLTVFTKALDDLDLDRPVKLIKVDVEGHEETVFKGAKKLLQKDKPLVIFEYTKTENFICRAHEVMKSYNYICYDFNTLKEFSDPVEPKCLTDIIAIPKSLAPNYLKKLHAISELT